MEQIRYSFVAVAQCNMCGAPASDHRVLGKRLNAPQGMRPKRKKGITTTVVKCGACGLVFADPQPVPVDLQDHYGVPPESYWKAEYFTVSPDYFAPAIARF